MVVCSSVSEQENGKGVLLNQLNGQYCRQYLPIFFQLLVDLPFIPFSSKPCSALLKIIIEMALTKQQSHPT